MPPPKRPDVVREDGDLLVVSHGARLGGACVTCAAGDGLLVRFELLHHARPWTWLLLPTGALGIVLMSLLQRTAGVMLPVCRDCDARWRRAVRVRSWVALSLLPVSFVAMGAFYAEARGCLPSGAGGWIALGLTFAWAAAYLAARYGRSRHLVVTPASIDRELLHLRGVHPDARRAIVAASRAVRR
jgi:hypothetical protein